MTAKKLRGCCKTNVSKTRSTEWNLGYILPIWMTHAVDQIIVRVEMCFSKSDSVAVLLLLSML